MRYVALLLLLLVLLFLSGTILTGCANDPASPALASSSSPAGAPREPIAVQLLRADPELKSQRFSNLLSFESPTDQVFVTAPAGNVLEDPARAHTGGQSLRIEAGTPSITIKVSALRSPGWFPAKWTLLGGYFYTESPASVIASYAVGGNLVEQNRVDLKPGRWTPVMSDVKSFPDFSLTDDALIQLTFEVQSQGPVWCDDVMLVDNTQAIITGDPSDSSKWTIQRRGLNIIGEVPGRFTFELPVRDYAPDGWRVVEVNSMRARFLSSGPTQKLTVYCDGRAYWDGEFKPLGEARLTPAFAEAHASPAQIDLPEDLGRVNRNTPGDANNDGYNELLGSYQIVASGPRLELKITPRSSLLVNPVLEITGLPKGKALVNLDGQPVETIVRLDDGTLLVEVPASIDRAATVAINVQ